MSMNSATRLERLVLEGLDVVVEPHEGGAADQLLREDAQVERVDEGRDEEREEQHHERHGEHEPREPVPAGATVSLAASSGRPRGRGGGGGLCCHLVLES
jgi:hypothetical protein